MTAYTEFPTIPPLETEGQCVSASREVRLWRRNPITRPPVVHLVSRRGAPGMRADPLLRLALIG